nr:MAG TPA: hypothetical protein [Caudoviricetes sp.]
MTEFSRFNDSEGYFCLYKNKPPWCYPVRSPISELYPYNIKLFIPCQHFFQISCYDVYRVLASKS